MHVIFSILTLSLAAVTCQLPNLSVGDHNITSQHQLRDLLKSEPFFLLSISASWCRHCCLLEPVLQKTKELIQKQGALVKIYRADLDSQHYFKRYMQNQDSPPKIFVVNKGKFYKYSQQANPIQIIQFISKIYHPVHILDTQKSVQEFLIPPKGEQNFLRLLAFLYDQDQDEESVQNQYQRIARQLAQWSNLRIAAVTNRTLIKEFKKEGTINFLNSLLLMKRDTRTKELDIAAPEELDKWISKNGVGLVQELTPLNFPIYQQIKLPLLILFIDKNNIHQHQYLRIFRKAAVDFQDYIKFVWLDGSTEENKARKRKIGLVTEILPSMAFNLLDGRIISFDESAELTQESIAAFAADFLDGKLKSTGKKPTWKVDPQLQKAYSNTKKVKIEEFGEKVLKEGDDVMVLFYSSHNSPKSYDIAPYFNQVAKRFGELEFNNFRVFRMDVAIESVPKNIKIQSIPSIYFFPAFHKEPPYVVYTHQVKVLPIMFFAEKYSDIKFELPELPHLSPDQVELYYKQKAEMSEEKRLQVEKVSEKRDWDL